jgi:hypothetical protein
MNYVKFGLLLTTLAAPCEMILQLALFVRFQ